MSAIEAYANATVKDRGQRGLELEAGGACQVLVGGDDADAPAFEARLEDRAEGAVQGDERSLVADTRAIGWVEDHEAERAWRRLEVFLKRFGPFE